MGISQIRIKGRKDYFQSGEIIEFLSKIDNSLSISDVKHVSLKLSRIIKFRQNSEAAQSLGDPVQKFTIFHKKYPGLEASKCQKAFTNKMFIDLAEIFNLKKQ